VAITRVGAITSSTAGVAATAGGQLTIPISTLTGLAAGDYLIISIVDGLSTTDVTGPATASGNSSGAVFNKVVDSYGNDTNDTNLFVYTGFVGGTVDTSVVLTGLTASRNYAIVVSAYRGVNTTTPLDVTTVVATPGTNTDLANPPAITPTTAGTKIVAVYGGAQGTSTAWGAPASGVANFTQGRSVSTSKGITAQADADWTSGAFDPAIVSSGDANAQDCWCAATLALRAGVTTFSASVTETASAADAVSATGGLSPPTLIATLKGAGTNSFSLSLAGLTDLRTDDFLVLNMVNGNVQTNQVPGAVGNNGGAGLTTTVASNYANSGASGENDTSQTVFLIQQGATPDASITITNAGGNNCWTLAQYRGVRLSNPQDVTATVATGFGVNDLSNPAAITPATPGARIVVCYAGAQQTVTVWGVPSDVDNFQQQADSSGAGGHHGLCAMADKVWISGAFNPNAIPSGDTNATPTVDSWAAVTLALRPSVSTLTADVTEAATATDLPIGATVIDTAAVVDAAAASESSSGIKTTSSAQTDAGAATDAQTSSKATPVARVEAGAASEVVAASAVFFAIGGSSPSSWSSIGGNWDSRTWADSSGASESSTATRTTTSARVEAATAAESSSNVATRNAAIVEILTASSTQSGALVAPVLALESGSATDTISAAQTAFASAVGDINEDGGAFEDLDASIDTQVAIAESATATEGSTPLVLLGGLVIEATSANDVQSGLQIAFASATEAAAAVDLGLGVKVTASLIIESGVASDVAAAVQAVFGQRTEQATAADTPGGGVIGNAAASEATTGTDTTSAVKATAASAVEGALASEGQSGVKATGAALGESTAASEGVSAVRVTTAASAESASASEQSFTFGAGGVFVAETALALDVVSAAQQFSSSRSEPATASDLVSASTLAVALVVEALAAAEAASALRIAAASATEAATASDAPSALQTAVAAVLEAATAVDLNVNTAIFPASVVESSTATDALSAGRLLPVSRTEAAAALDAVSVAAFIVAAVAEAAAALEQSSFAGSALSSVVEAAAASDAVSGVAAVLLSHLEAANAAELAVSGRLAPANVAENALATEQTEGSRSAIADQIEAILADEVSDAAAILNAAIAEAGAASEELLPIVGIIYRVFEQANATVETSATAIFEATAHEAAAAEALVRALEAIRSGARVFKVDANPRAFEVQAEARSLPAPARRVRRVLSRPAGSRTFRS
jgi:hypothetical protein